jgi:glycine/D-amino acid oxidase-like deaminating enzyme
MNIAIVGAGYAGLALCWHFLKIGGCRVTLFDVPGKGASQISSGLLHPYPGEQASKTWEAERALKATKELLDVASKTLKCDVANDRGIIRFAIHERQKRHLIARAQTFSDIEQIGEREFLIHSGMTVYSSLYTQGLVQACKERGAVYYPVKVMTTGQLKEYDQIILACGADIARFAESRDLKLKYVKGQILTCLWPDSFSPLQRSLIGKGHIALGAEPGTCVVGATYEKGFIDDKPSEEEAAALLFPKISAFFPEVGALKILDCRAGLRVLREGSYLPLIQKIGEKTWAFTALGSRGLLYHAYFAEILVQAVLSSQEPAVPLKSSL